MLFQDQKNYPTVQLKESCPNKHSFCINPECWVPKKNNPSRYVPDESYTFENIALINQFTNHYLRRDHIRESREIITFNQAKGVSDENDN